MRFDDISLYKIINKTCQREAHHEDALKKKSVGGDDFGAEETSLLKSTRGEAEDTDDDEHERQEELNKYLENCAKFGVKVDPSVCVTLATGWSVLRLSKESSSEGSLLPLMGILEGNSRVKKVDLQSISMSDYRFRSAGNGNSMPEF